MDCTSEGFSDSGYDSHILSQIDSTSSIKKDESTISDRFIDQTLLFTKKSVKNSKEILSPIYENRSPNPECVGDSNAYCIRQKNNISKKIQWLEQSDTKIVSEDNYKTCNAKPYTSTPYSVQSPSQEWSITDSFNRKITLADQKANCENVDNELPYKPRTESNSRRGNEQTGPTDLQNGLLLKTNMDSGIHRSPSKIDLHFCPSNEMDVTESNFISMITDTPLNSHKVVNLEDSSNSKSSFESCVSELDYSIDPSETVSISESVTPTKLSDHNLHSDIKMRKVFSMTETFPRHSPYKSTYLSHVKLGTPEKNELLYSRITFRTGEKQTSTKFKKNPLKMMKSMKKTICSVNQENVSSISNDEHKRMLINVTEIKKEPSNIVSNNIGPDMDKILGIKHSKKVDFLKLFMEKTSNFQLVEKIYSYLDAKDLVNMYCCSKLGRLSISKSEKLNNKRENYLQLRRLTKENIIEHPIVEKKTRNLRLMVKSSSFPCSDPVSVKFSKRRCANKDTTPISTSETSNQRFKFTQQYHPYKAKQKSPDPSPSKREFNKYIKAQKFLLPGQTLTKCLQCMNPARVDNNISVCLKKSCRYTYCTKCLLSKCVSVLNYEGTDFENQHPYVNFLMCPSKSPPHLNTACGIASIKSVAVSKNFYFKDDSSEDTTDSKQNEFIKDSDSGDSSDSSQFCDRKNLGDISNKTTGLLNTNHSVYINDSAMHPKVNEPCVDYEFTVRSKVQSAKSIERAVHRVESSEYRYSKPSVEQTDVIKINSHKRMNDNAKYKRALFANRAKHVRRLDFCSLDETSRLGYKKPTVQQNSLQIHSISELVQMKNSKRERSVDSGISDMFVPSSPPKVKQDINIGSRKSKNNLRRL